MRSSVNIFLFVAFTLIMFQTACFSQVELTMPAQKPPSSTDKLAVQFYEQKEFEKANVYFEELFDKNPAGWFNYYYKSLLGAKDYPKAEKITKRQLKQNKQNVFLYVYLGRIYKLQNDEKKERETYEK